MERRKEERQANVVVAAVLKTVRRLKGSCGFNSHPFRQSFSYEMRKKNWRVIRDGDRHRLLNEWKGMLFVVQLHCSPPNDNNKIDLYKQSTNFLEIPPLRSG